MKLCRIDFLVAVVAMVTPGTLAQQKAGGRAAPLSLKPIEGPGGEDLAKRVQQLLARLGPFQVGMHPGAPLISGEMGEGFFTGRLQTGEGRELFERTYQQGSLDRDSRQFADDVLLTLTKRPGIATSQIAFAFSENGRAFQIFLSDFDGGNVRQITEKGTHLAPSISPDGTLLAHVTVEPGNVGRVNVIDLVKGKPLSVSTEPAQRIEMAFSPDGKQLAISMSDGPGPNNDLYLLKLPRGKPTPLTRTPVPETSPSWSPDGSRIVFAAPPGPDRSDLFILDVRKKATTPLPTGYPVAIDPAWSPDGTRIAFVAISGQQRTLCVRNLQTQQTQRLTSGSQPFWGADSRHLIFVTGDGKLSMIQVDTGRISPVVLGGGRAIDPSWTR